MDTISLVLETVDIVLPPTAMSAVLDRHKLPILAVQQVDKTILSPDQEKKNGIFERFVCLLVYWL